MDSIIEFGRRFAKLFIDKRLPTAASALAYNLTMTFFPLIIVLYTLLGNNYERAMWVVALTEKLLAAETVSTLKDFLAYVALQNNNAMLIAGMTMLITSASSSVRSLNMTIGGMQGGAKYHGIWSIPFSIVFSLLFIAAIYISMLILLTGSTFIRQLNLLLPFVDIGNSWSYIRFFVLTGLVFAIVWAVYAFSRRKEDTYDTFPGAIIATAAMVAVSIVFSVFISASTRYSLIYGSLASLILLMFWLYVSSLVLYCGAAFNIVLRDIKESA